MDTEQMAVYGAVASATDLPAVSWRKSSHSGGSGGDCLEMGYGPHRPVGAVPVRDSKNPWGPAIVVPVAAWSAFVTAVREGALRGGSLHEG